MAERCCEVGGAEPKQLLARIERIAVLRRKAARRRNALDIGEQQTACGKRDDPLHVAQPQRRAGEARQAARNVARDRNAVRRQAENRCHHDGQCDDGERHRPPGQQPLA